MTDVDKLADALDKYSKGIFPEGVTGSCYITTREAWYKALELVREQAAQVVEKELSVAKGKKIADMIRGLR